MFLASLCLEKQCFCKPSKNCYSLNSAEEMMEMLLKFIPGLFGRGPLFLIKTDISTVTSTDIISVKFELYNVHRTRERPSTVVETHINDIYIMME